VFPPIPSARRSSRTARLLSGTNKLARIARHTKPLEAVTSFDAREEFNTESHALRPAHHKRNRADVGVVLHLLCTASRSRLVLIPNTPLSCRHCSLDTPTKLNVSVQRDSTIDGGASTDTMSGKVSHHRTHETGPGRDRGLIAGHLACVRCIFPRPCCHKLREARGARLKVYSSLHDPTPRCLKSIYASRTHLQLQPGVHPRSVVS